MAWHQAHTKPLLEMIQVHGAYVRLSDSLVWLIHSAGKNIAMKCGETLYC